MARTHAALVEELNIPKWSRGFYGLRFAGTCAGLLMDLLAEGARLATAAPWLVPYRAGSTPERPEGSLAALSADAKMGFVANLPEPEAIAALQGKWAFWSQNPKTSISEELGGATVTVPSDYAPGFDAFDPDYWSRFWIAPTTHTVTGPPPTHGGVIMGSTTLGPQGATAAQTNAIKAAARRSRPAQWVHWDTIYDAPNGYRYRSMAYPRIDPGFVGSTLIYHPEVQSSGLFNLEGDGNQTSLPVPGITQDVDVDRVLIFVIMGRVDGSVSSVVYDGVAATQIAEVHVVPGVASLDMYAFEVPYSSLPAAGAGKVCTVTKTITDDVGVIVMPMIRSGRGPVTDVAISSAVTTSSAHFQALSVAQKSTVIWFSGTGPRSDIGAIVADTDAEQLFYSSAQGGGATFTSAYIHMKRDRRGSVGNVIQYAAAFPHAGSIGFAFSQGVL